MSKRTLLVLSTLGLLGVIYCIFYFGYIPKKESHLTSEKFRALNQMAKNVNRQSNDLYHHEKIYKDQKKQGGLGDLKPGSDRIEELLKRSLETESQHLLNNQMFDEIVAGRPGALIYQSNQNIIQIESRRDSAARTIANELSETISGNMGWIKISEVLYRSFTVYFKAEIVNSTASYFLVGLVKDSEFRSQSRRLSDWVSIVIAILFLLLLMSMPWIKLWSMNHLARLYQANVLAVIFSIVVGFALLFLGFFSIRDNVFERSDLKKSLPKLSNSISNQFQTEIETKIKTLAQIDSKGWEFLAALNERPPGSIIAVNNIWNNPQLKELTDSSINNFLWVDKDDNVQVLLSKSGEKPKRDTISLRDRLYHQRIRDRDYWLLRGVDTLRFALQSIQSWEKRTNEAGIGIPSKMVTDQGRPMVTAAMATNLESVIDPVIKQGFGFAIIGDDGNVWFHSDRHRNNQENFFEELRSSERLRNLVAYGSTGIFRERYHHRNHLIHVGAIRPLPLTLITFYDLTHNKSRAGLVIAISFGLLAAYLIFLFLLVIFYRILLHKRSKLKRQRIRMSFLMPDRERHKRLAGITWCLLLLILLEVSVHYVAAHYYIFSTISFGLFSLLVHVALSIVFILYLYYVLAQDQYHKHIFFRSSIFLIIALNFFYSQSPSGDIFLLLICEALGFLIIFACFDLGRTFSKPDRNSDKKAKDEKNDMPNTFLDRLSWTTKYVLFYTLFVLFITLPPAMISYDFGHSLVKLLDTRDIHNVLAQQISQESQQKVQREIGKYYDGGSTRDSTNGQLDNDILVPGLAFFTELKRRWWSRQSTKTLASRPINTDDENIDSSILCCHHQRSFFTKLMAFSDDPRIIIGKISDDHVFGKIFLTIVALSFLFLFLFQLIRWSCRRIFAQDFESYGRSSAFANGLLLSHKKGRRLFIVELPNSGAEKKLAEYMGILDAGDLTHLEIDFAKGELEVSDQFTAMIYDKEVIIVKNFHHRANDHQTWQSKLAIMEMICANPEREVIIWSRIRPLVVANFYATMIQKIYNKQWDANFRDEYQAYRHAKTHWQQFFANFVEVYEPLSTDAESMPSGEASWKDIVLGELFPHGSYLLGLYPTVAAYCRNLEKNKQEIIEDDVINKIQILAESYYFSIWTALSKEEKFLLYDLAIDGFVNCRNDITIRRLIEKGLLVYRNNLRLMNESFNNFVLTVVDREMDNAMRREMYAKGNWSSIQIVIVVLIIAIGTFLLLDQKQILDNFQATLATLVALGGVLIRFTGLWYSFGSEREK